MCAVHRVITMPTLLPLILCGIAIVTGEVQQQNTVAVVTTPDGPLRGRILNSRNSRRYFSFRGIKYGNIRDRFELAQPVQPWTKPVDAFDFGSVCPQPETLVGGPIKGSEDCLFLNVYVPDIRDAKPLPVMFWIHGGAYFAGAGSEVGADFFMDEDVVLVTINYRLGVLGFINTEDGGVTVNNGLKDMILALKWVQRNIGAFGGDPEKVTIFGESAGGVSGHLLMLSPAAKGLFRAVIAQSGSGLCSWSFSSSPRSAAMKLSQSLNCSSEDFVDCLRRKDIHSLLNGRTDPTAIGEVNLPFVPSAESVLSSSNNEDFAVLPTTPYELLTKHYDNSKTVPLVIGTNKNEGILVSAWPFLVNETSMNTLKDNWVALSSVIFYYKNYVPSKDMEMFARALRSIYYGDADISMETAQALIDMYTESYFARAARISAELHARAGANVYPYILTYAGSFSMSQMVGFPDEGPTHADDLQYLFPCLSPVKMYPDLKPNSADVEFSKKLVATWATFAANGVPNSTWVNNWEPIAFPQLRNSNFRLVRLETEPRFGNEDDSKFTRIVNMDTLFSRFEKPQLSWRAEWEAKVEL